MEENNMDQTTVTSQETPEVATEQEEKSMGAVLGSIIVVIILLVAAFYLWGNRPQTQEPIMEDTPAVATEFLNVDDPQTAALDAQSDSDDLDSIEQDLSNTDLNNLTAELEVIENDLTTTP